MIVSPKWTVRTYLQIKHNRKFLVELFFLGPGLVSILFHMPRGIPAVAFFCFLEAEKQMREWELT